ncbi:MAG: hypothetical protein H0V56_09435, partial [Chthoniobacterales bacterium]|nr:hypothetical protein [Chthoniobacterales bacterium]
MQRAAARGVVFGRRPKTAGSPRSPALKQRAWGRGEAGMRINCVASRTTMNDTPPPSAVQGAWLPRFLQAVGIVVGVGIAILVVWKAAEVLLLAFGGALLALLLRGAAGWIHERTKLPMGLSLTFVGLLLLSALTAAVYFLSPMIGRQVQELKVTV